MHQLSERIDELVCKSSYFIFKNTYSLLLQNYNWIFHFVVEFHMNPSYYRWH